MKAINANYSVRVGYWALRNNVQEYKVYVVMIRMFNLDFVNTLRQVPKDNPWPVESTNHNYRTHLLCQAKYLLGMNKVDQYLLVEVPNVARNENDPKNDDYELPIVKYDANHDALVEQKEKTTKHEEEEPRTPS